MKRAGYTLMELVLVMSLLVIAATLSMPVVESMLRPGRVAAAKDQVRSICADLRGKAMLEGRPYRFSVMDGTGKFRLEPDDAPEEKGFEQEEELPEQVLFASDAASLQNKDSAAAGSGWRTIAVFQPDGSALDDGTIIFGLQGEPPTQLRLRALTGAISRDDANTSSVSTRGTQ
ncbi:MAG: prepilin-type N-terminal cleavage/methylation domain-containing protein [Gemmataceae bacterium]|nr:prepilin-type N-terminal cleavage/methylation domain-containing protein [Gemmataceae bacterium]